MLGAHSFIIVGRWLSFANCTSQTVSTVKLRLACYMGNSFNSRICGANYTRYGHSNACLMSALELADFGGCYAASSKRREECSVQALGGGSLKSQLAYFFLYLDALRYFSNIPVL